MNTQHETILVPAELFETTYAFGLLPIPTAAESRELVPALTHCEACGKDLGASRGILLGRQLFCGHACAHVAHLRASA